MRVKALMGLTFEGKQYKRDEEFNVEENELTNDLLLNGYVKKVEVKQAKKSN